jgi:hypothetical protein
MDVLSEVDISPRAAVRIMTEFVNDPFLAERDPDLVKSVKRVLANLAIAPYEISPSDPPHSLEAPTAHLESPRRRRRHSTKAADSP